MSMYLSVYVLNDEDLRDRSIAADIKTRLVFPQNYEIISQVSGREGYFQDFPAPTVKARELPSTMTIDLSGEIHNADSCGDPLKFTYAEKFKKINLPEIIDRETKAILAFLAELAPQTPILIWWH
jgi:hypothetical protein